MTATPPASPSPPSGDDTAAALADASLAQFIDVMTDHDNPGAAPHEIGSRKVHGWILERDPQNTGATPRAVVGIDGTVHARDGGLRALLGPRRLGAAAWVRRRAGADEPMAIAVAFAARLSEILAVNDVAEG